MITVGVTTIRHRGLGFFELGPVDLIMELKNKEPKNVCIQDVERRLNKLEQITARIKTGRNIFEHGSEIKNVSLKFVFYKIRLMLQGVRKPDAIR